MMHIRASACIVQLLPISPFYNINLSIILIYVSVKRDWVKLTTVFYHSNILSVMHVGISNSSETNSMFFLDKRVLELMEI